MTLVSEAYLSRQQKLQRRALAGAETAKDFRHDYYVGLKGLYFFRILRTIIQLGALDRRNVKVLDFGCGAGHLGQLLPGKVIGYDIIPELSDLEDWREAEFDVMVANEVFYLFTRETLRKFLCEVKDVNPAAEVLVGISRQGLLNNIGKYLAGEPDAHAGTKLDSKQELAILSEQLDTLKRSSVLQMCDIYYMKFKGR